MYQFPSYSDLRPLIELARDEDLRGDDVTSRLMVPESAVGVGTANFHEPRAVNRIHDELAGWCAGHGVARVADLAGALETEPLR